MTSLMSVGQIPGSGSPRRWRARPRVVGSPAIAMRDEAIDDFIGRSASLPIRRITSPGAFLGLNRENTGAEAPCVLLPGGEIPDGAKEGDSLEVFVYLDSQDRPVATTRCPMLERGEVAFLEMTAATQFGSFVDWGLPKELLVPFAEQTTEMRVGERYPVGLYLDKTGRLAGTMRVAEMLDRAMPEFRLDEWVDGEAWRNDPKLGLFVIVERTFVGRVPATEPHGPPRGEGARFRVTNILPDRKSRLSLRGLAHGELERDAARILQVLRQPGTPKVGDRSSPDEIRAIFGLSKKAFKRAAGRLLKQRAVGVTAEGHLEVVCAEKA